MACPWAGALDAEEEEEHVFEGYGPESPRRMFPGEAEARQTRQQHLESALEEVRDAIYDHPARMDGDDDGVAAVRDNNLSSSAKTHASRGGGRGPQRVAPGLQVFRPVEALAKEWATLKVWLRLCGKNCLKGESSSRSSSSSVEVHDEEVTDVILKHGDIEETLASSIDADDVGPEGRRREARAEAYGFPPVEPTAAMYDETITILTSAMWKALAPEIAAALWVKEVE